MAVEALAALLAELALGNHAPHQGRRLEARVVEFLPQVVRDREAHVEADEVVWNYAPSGRNQIIGEPFDETADVFVKRGPGRIGSSYLKCLYRGYTDGSFSTRMHVPASESYLGFMGPVMRGEVGDTIKVVFRNTCRIPASVHPHGVFYQKASEGAPYADNTSGVDKKDDAVPRYATHTYTWLVPDRAGPGPHDGSSIFEKALAQLITARGNLDVVMAAGNSYLARGHAEIALGSGTTALPDWHVLADDGTPSFLELWFPRSTDVHALTLTVHSPRGEVRVLAGPGELRFTGRGQVVALASLQQRTASGEAPMALIAVAPTTWAERWDVPAPSGRWKVELQHAGTQSIVCQAYVQRDDAAIGRPTRGRQSWLDDPGYERLDARGDVQLRDNTLSTVRRDGTLNGLATGAGVHVAGGALARAGGALEPARYSSAPDAERCIAGPDEFALAITEDSPVLAGVLAAGTASGSVLALSGTSTAAPQLARQLAMRRVTGALAVAWDPAQDFQGRAVSVLPVAAGRRTRQRRRVGLPP